MGIFKKTNYVDLGRHGTEDKFLQAIGKVKSSNRGIATDLIDGAVQAFRDGRPQHIQLAFKYAKDLEDWYSCPRPAATILLKLTEGSDDKLADIALVLAGIPENDKTARLNDALDGAIGSAAGGEPFFSLLLRAGAEANAKIDRYPGTLLGLAACYRSPSLVKLLYENGASFDEAISRLPVYSESWHGTEGLDRLKFYQEVMAGKPDVVEIEKDTFQQLLELVSELTEEVECLKSSKPASNAQQPEKPQEKKLCLSLKGPRQPKKTGAASTL